MICHAVMLAVLLLVASDCIGSDLEETDFEVNEGELFLIGELPDDRVHTHVNTIYVKQSSLGDGWAEMFQCHSHMDPVPDTQIVFNSGRIRELRIHQHNGIGEAKVDGHTVQLKNVEPDAGICLSAQTRVVEKRKGGGFSVRNGPFMRSFLDGYYPMRVNLEIRMPPGEWDLVNSEPQPQPGFKVTYNGTSVLAEAVFEGRLTTRFEFDPTQGKKQKQEKQDDR